MNKDLLLKRIADTAYNVGFGAKKHFSTYDIVDKVPSFIGFASMSIGILSLIYEFFSNKLLSAALTILGVMALYINFYDSSRDQYAKRGEELTLIFNELKSLYFKVKASSSASYDAEAAKLNELEARHCEISMSKQIMFSDWYAHYKFFWQHQIDWIDEQKNFKFWRDKVPLSLIIVVSLAVLASIVCLLTKLFS